jgi:hypothetical protein
VADPTRNVESQKRLRKWLGESPTDLWEEDQALQDASALLEESFGVGVSVWDVSRRLRLGCAPGIPALWVFRTHRRELLARIDIYHQLDKTFAVAADEPWTSDEHAWSHRHRVARSTVERLRDRKAADLKRLFPQLATEKKEGLCRRAYEECIDALMSLE